MTGKQVLIPNQAVLKQNAILGGLSPAMATEVLKTAKLIALETSQQIYEADLPIRDVYFPIDAVLSVVTQMRDGGSIEVGTVGRRESRQSLCCSEQRPRPTKVIAKFLAARLSLAATIFDNCSTAEMASFVA